MLIFNTSRERLLTGGPVVIAVLAVALLFLTSREAAPDAPEVSWTPGSVEETILAGESRTVPVSFTLSDDVDGLAVLVSAEIEPFVEVVPASFGELEEGQTVNLDVLIAVPATSAPGTFGGLLELLEVDDADSDSESDSDSDSGSDSDSDSDSDSEEDSEDDSDSDSSDEEILSLQLPVLVSVEWPATGIEGLALSYPPSWQLQVQEGPNVTLPSLLIRSPQGALLLVLPEGGLGYGMDPEVASLESFLQISGYPARQRDYLGANGEVSVRRIVFDPPIESRPDLLFEFRPAEGEPDVEEILEIILASVQL